MGTPQIGPGKGARFERGQRDEGRARVTGRPEDLYRFRTPSLRNVAATAPYGHAGAHGSLASFVAHHAIPGRKTYDFDGVLPAAVTAKDALAPLADQPEIARILGAAEAPARDLNPAQIADLVAFLHSLSDPRALAGRWGVPDAVPSGLPIDN